MKNKPTLTSLRRELSALDQELLVLLSRRKDLTLEIGNMKFQKGLDILQSKVWDANQSKRRKKAQKLNLDIDVMEKVFNLLHRESLSTQKKLYRKLKHDAS